MDKDAYFPTVNEETGIGYFCERKYWSWRAAMSSLTPEHEIDIELVDMLDYIDSWKVVSWKSGIDLTCIKYESNIFIVELLNALSIEGTVASYFGISLIKVG